METLDFWVVSLLVFAFGASVGSFLNVVVYRLPAGLSLLNPPSRCPQCLHRLRVSENVPIFGWLRLQGRCAHCRSPISVRYPLVEAATGWIFLSTFWAFGLSLQTPGYWLFFSCLLALSLIDLDTMTLPNPLTQFGVVTGLLFQAWVGLTHDFSVSGLLTQLMTGIVGAVLGIWLLDLVRIVGTIAFGQEAMGGGDSKLAAMMGAWLGWKLLLLSGFLACLVGSVIGGGAIALKLMNRRQPMPFGPFLALGAVLAAFWGETLIATYLQVFFPLR
ncbi:MAG: A24 family peptidase [Scytolyngbya sp. HA4215-MV1]|jgi:leader peptidase (prepilin peptidase)/N-methyltransferase|nr:A24 family peptidase [Scytolyngbya sp. HA4215-MV1]